VPLHPIDGAGFVRQKKREEDAIFYLTRDGIFFPLLFCLTNPAQVGKLSPAATPKDVVNPGQEQLLNIEGLQLRRKTVHRPLYFPSAKKCRYKISNKTGLRIWTIFYRLRLFKSRWLRILPYKNLLPVPTFSNKSFLTPKCTFLLTKSTVARYLHIFLCSLWVTVPVPVLISTKFLF
jgi:hypothetical protein